MEALNMLDSFHLLRPWWLVSIPFWIWLSYRVWNIRQHTSGWSSLCDPALFSYLVGEAGQQQGQQRSTSKAWLVAISMAGVIASIALAGPVWKQLPQPVFRSTSAMIIILDLSRSMDAEDIKPSRLIRARQKIQDILSARTEGQTGLIVFAGSAFDVVPLTTDNKAILSLLSSLDTSMMPAQGSLASLALTRAQAMFQRGAIQAGSVVMLCDGVDTDAVAAAQKLSKAGHQVSVLAIGTVDGAPIPMRSEQGAGGFMQDSSGNIVIPHIDPQRLMAVSNAGHGIFQYARFDDTDVQQLPGLIPSHFAHNTTAQDNQENTVQTDQWQEEGAWLVWLLLPLCLLAFRRGMLLAWLCIPVGLSVAFPTSSQAMEFGWNQIGWNNTEWKQAWKTPDQQAQTLMRQGKNNEAASLFQNPSWKAAALYRAGKYNEAAKALANSQDADQLYNKANALARAGKLKKARKAYDAALAAYPKDQSDNNRRQDAQFNRDLVDKLLKKQEKQNKKTSKKNQENKNNKQANKPSPKQQGSKGDKKGKPQKNAPASDQQGAQTPADKKNQTAKQQDQQEKPSKGHDKPKPKQTQANPSKTADKNPSKPGQKASSLAKKIDPAKLEKQHAQQQMLRRIPDDPGGLLRRKFKYQYQNQQQQPRSQQAW